ncbi:hypothetical protein [Bacillus bombysepticus]|uniref:hypothetical protein n=1 Tax=Bacillus bombysepticus TaxID=658666 RepID=UPI0030193907
MYNWYKKVCLIALVLTSALLLNNTNHVSAEEYFDTYFLDEEFNVTINESPDMETQLTTGRSTTKPMRFETWVDFTNHGTNYLKLSIAVSNYPPTDMVFVEEYTLNRWEIAVNLIGRYAAPLTKNHQVGEWVDVTTLYPDDTTTVGTEFEIGKGAQNGSYPIEIMYKFEVR